MARRRLAKRSGQGKPYISAYDVQTSQLACTCNRYSVVLLESLAGTGHRRVITRMKEAPKTEQIMKDPLIGQDVLYKEIKKIKSLKVPRRV